MSRHVGQKPRSRRSLFFTILVAPFVAIATIEVVFRLTAVGGLEPLFIDAPVSGYLQVNTGVIDRFFLKPQAAPKPRAQAPPFREDKPADGVRIVVQGGSSAAGFPYGWAASPAAMLQDRLQASMPERTVEIVSTAMPESNSLMLLDLADEIIDIEPDVVVIYVGHDEFAAPGGAIAAYSSDRSPEMTRLLLRLRRLHLVEAGFQVYGAAVSMKEIESARTASVDRPIPRIPYGGEVFTAVQKQFRENLVLLLQKYRRHGIPVLIGTLASNEQHQAPFIAADLPMSVAKPWHETLADVEAVLASGDTDAAIAGAGELVKLAPENAMSWFAQGEASLLRGRSSEARHAFLKAKDLDELRVRAPESFNDIIRAAALEHGAVLVDVQQAFAIRSPAGIIGRELMREHQHPNIDGYFYLADAYYVALRQMDSLPSSIEVPAAEARSHIPVTAVDRVYGEWRAQRLLHSRPFVADTADWAPPKPRNAIQTIARDWYEGRSSWREALEQAQDYYRKQGDRREFSRVAVTRAMANPADPEAAHAAGSELLAAEEVSRAIPFLRRAAALAPGNGRYLVSLAMALDMAGRPEDALVVREQAMTVEPAPGAEPGLIEKLRSEFPRKD
jgi:Flp pilus assembly protein TadD